MKKQLMRVVGANFSKFFKATAFVVVLSGASYVSANAAPVLPVVLSENPGATNAEINHIGTANGMLVFEVKVANAKGEKFRVLVKDIEGTTLFQDSYSDKNFSKKFMIPKPDSDKLVFVIRSASGNTFQTFEINSNTRIVEDVVVKRIS